MSRRTSLKDTIDLLKTEQIKLYKKNYPFVAEKEFILCRNCHSTINVRKLSKEFKDNINMHCRAECPVCKDTHGMYTPTEDAEIKYIEKRLIKFLGEV